MHNIKHFLNFLKIQKRFGSLSLFNKISKSFKQEIKTPFNKDKAYSIKDKNITSDVFNNLKNIFNKKNKELYNEKKFFDYYIQTLIKYEGIFTYEKFQYFLKDLCNYFGLFSIKYKYKKKLNPELEKLKKQYEVLNSFLPVELQSDDYKIFNEENKKILAKSSNVDVKFINDLLLFHDTLKTDRTWLYRRIMFKRELPDSFEQREIEAMYDRPLIKTFNYNIKESSLEYETAFNKENRKFKFKKWYSKHYPWFRKCTSGRDRWRTLPYTKKFPYLYYKNNPKYLYLSKNKPKIKE